MRIVMTALVLLFSVDAVAHGVKLFVRTEGGEMIGTASFDDDKPISGAKVTVYQGDTVLAELETNEAGEFRHSHDPSINYRIAVRTPDGHRASAELRGRAEATVPAHDHSHDHSHSHDDDHSHEAPQADLERQIGELREDIHRLETTIRFRDTIGGIGYIMGVLGLIALLKRRQG